MEEGTELEAGVIVVDLPCTGGIAVPSIWVATHGGIALERGPFLWAWGRLRVGATYDSVSATVKSIAALTKLYVRRGCVPLDEHGLRELVLSFLSEELSGRPYSAKQAVLSHLVKYSEWAQVALGYFPLVNSTKVPLLPPEDQVKSFFRLMRLNESDVFSHLAARRERSQPEISAGRAPRTSRVFAEAMVGMNRDLAWRIVNAETNPTFRAIWLLGFFGGPRISEVLNLWVCDVLPGHFRQEWFRGDIFTDLPLVVLCDPFESKWTGTVGRYRESRERFLKEAFGLHPRPVLRERERGKFRGKYAGFKGMAATNADLLCRQVMWVDEIAAKQFEVVFEEVLHIRSKWPLARLHPFLFVNTDPRKSEVAGDMITMSNVRKAWERAVIRVGETPYRHKQRPHGMRHFFKQELAGLVDDRRIIQLCLGHRAIGSQDLYGSLDLQAMRHAMMSRSQVLLR